MRVRKSISGPFFRLPDGSFHTEYFSFGLKDFSQFLFSNLKKCMISLNGIFIKMIDFYKELFFFLNNWNRRGWNFFLIGFLRNCHSTPCFFSELGRDLKEV